MIIELLLSWVDEVVGVRESSDSKRALFDFLGLCRVLYGFSENFALRSDFSEVLVISSLFRRFC